MATSPASPERPRKRPRFRALKSIEQRDVRKGTECPYMDTIARQALDFDLPPICSVSLQSHNVYICLVCGKYVQGRSSSSHAYSHSLQTHHHLFINISTRFVYCLPEGYQVVDPSLADLGAALRPTFSRKEINNFDELAFRFRVLDGSTRLRGAVPLDNLQATDYANAVFQLILRPPPVRDFLLLKYAVEDLSMEEKCVQIEKDESDASTVEFSRPLSSLCAKIWASNAFRSHVAPHDLMQLVGRRSQGRFGQLKQADPIEFTAWLLNDLAQSQMSSKLRSKSKMARLIEETFKGEMEVETFTDGGGTKMATSPFWYLPLDLPPKPLFKDTSERTLVAQVTLNNLLDKFNGHSRHHIVKNNCQRTYRLTKVPSFLILVIRRFSKSSFGVQKNPCVVHLPAEGLDLSDIAPTKGKKFSLIAAVLHEGTPEDGKYRIVLRHEATKSWHDLTDLAVKPTPEQLIALSDTYILLYSASSSTE